MERIKISPDEFSKWKKESVQIYARETVHEKLLTMFVDLHGDILITYGLQTLYVGSDLKHASLAWDTLEVIEENIIDYPAVLNVIQNVNNQHDSDGDPYSYNWDVIFEFSGQFLIIARHQFNERVERIVSGASIAEFNINLTKYITQ